MPSPAPLSPARLLTAALAIALLAGCPPPIAPVLPGTAPTGDAQPPATSAPVTPPPTGNPPALPPTPAVAGPTSPPSPSPLPTVLITSAPAGAAAGGGGGGGGAPVATPTPQPPHVVVSVTPITSLPPTAPPSPPAPGFTAGQKLLFVSNRDGNQEIYLADANATNPVRLTTDGANDLFPCFSGDRKEFVWSSDRGAGIFAIYRAWTDGTHVVRLTFGTLAATQPAFSPDGSKIAFVRWTSPSTSVIAVMNRDGSGETALTPDGGQAFAPSWSPDGSQLVCGSNHATPGIPVLYKVPAAGGTMTALTALNGAYYPVGRATWSPNGARIAYSSVQSNGPTSISLINADGSGRTTLTSGGDSDPVWSVDGSQLMFTTLAGGTSQLARINADGTGLTTLTSGPATYAQPSW